MLICTGLPRTGTTTLAKALDILGYNTLHYCHLTNTKTSKNMDDEIYRMIRGWSSHYDAIISPSLSEYPNSIIQAKYPVIICHRRDTYSWNRSIEQFGESISIYEQSIQNLEKIEQNCKNVLIFDVSAGDGWDKLCDFLSIQHPNTEFPHLNKSGNIYEI